VKSAKRKVVNAQLFMGDPQITNPQIFHDISFQKFVHCRPFIEKPAKTQLYACSVIFFICLRAVLISFIYSSPYTCIKTVIRLHSPRSFLLNSNLNNLKPIFVRRKFMF
jgi:hypothetical protein